MDLDKLPGNSKSKPEEQTRSSVVHGTVDKQKQTVGSRLQSELNNQWKDVLLPAAKDMVVDMLRSGLDGLIDMGKKTIDMKIYGEVKHHNRRGVRGASGWTNYNKSSKTSTHQSRDKAPEFENLIFDTRADAVAVLESLTDILEEYEVVSVADMLELAGEKPDYTDRKYGWFKLGRAEIIGNRNGYILSMPKPVVIK